MNGKSSVFSKANLVALFYFAVVCAFLICRSPISCFASVKDLAAALPDENLRAEYEWAIILDQSDLNSMLNYGGSKVWPLTKVRVQYRPYKEGDNSVPPSGILYEDVWYHDESTLGLRRYNEISIAERSFGAIVICPGKLNEEHRRSRALAMVDSIMRLVVDVQLRNAETTVVLVPANSYDDISEALGTFNFFAATPGIPLSPLNIHVRAYPEGADQFFYSRNLQ